jgi:hypothetical protein
MSRQFSIPTILRMTPTPLLRNVFRALGHSKLDLRWHDSRGQEIDAVLNYLDELPIAERNEIEGLLRSVFDLACESGFQAMLEAAAHCGVANLGGLVPDDLSLYGRATWVWLHHRQVFKLAQVIHRVEHMAWWRKRNDLPANTPDMSAEARRELEDEISFLLKTQGRGHRCTVETLSRDGMDYFFAYPDDFVQNVLVHDEQGQLAPESFRQTMQVVFAYNSEEGTLELSAKLPKLMKEKLETIFARTILHWRLGPHEPGAVYELNQLKDPSFDLTPDPADRLRVRIRRMQLAAKFGGRRLGVEVDDHDPDDDIHQAIDECMNLETVPLSEWNVTQVTFCFEFLPLAGRKHGQQTFNVGFPRSCNLRGARPERVELIQKYLRRWKIDRVRSPEDTLVAVGA